MLTGNTGQLTYMQTCLQTNSPTTCQLVYVGELTQVMHLSMVCPRMGGVGQPRGIRLHKAHVGWDEWCTILEVKSAKWPIRPELIPVSVAWSDWEYFYSPLDGMLVHCSVTPSIKFASTHLYTWVERGTVRVKCLAQEHNTMSPARP